jgi:hypothetical protein
MKAKLTIELSEDETTVLNVLLRHSGDNKATSHGKLDLAGLATMLLQDAALTIMRPGSWEGANMITVLRGHGYFD